MIQYKYFFLPFPSLFLRLSFRDSDNVEKDKYDVCMCVYKLNKTPIAFLRNGDVSQYIQLVEAVVIKLKKRRG